jgi:FdhD protein
MSDRAVVASVRRHDGDVARADQDLVAAEAPVTVEVRHPAETDARSLGVLMRTPGDDRRLVLGLLYAESIIDSIDDIVSIEEVQRDDGAVVVRVALAAHVPPLGDRLARTLTATSACGFCGRLALERSDARRATGEDPEPSRWTAEVIASMPDALRRRQDVFLETGGLHAAGLFDRGGALLDLAEDVGRHNAVDKLVGARLERGALPASGTALAVSGRVAYVIVQKAVRAGVDVIVAVGAPSSLAVEAARAADLTLVGFARGGRFNVYAGFGRVPASESSPTSSTRVGEPVRFKI